MKSVLLTVFSLALVLPASSASLVGLWEFNNAGNLGQATVGTDLTIAGTAPTHSATLADAVANSQSGVITTAFGVGNHLVATNALGGNGGGAFTNQYSILIDLQSPVASRGTWRSLYQTSPANGNDGDLFIRNSDTAVGVSALTYSAPINDTVWNRLVVTFNIGTSVTSYLNGTLLHNHSASTLDGRFALDTTFLLFGDEDGENNPLNVGTVAFWDGALTGSEVAALGVAGSPVPEPTGALLILLAAAGSIVRRRR
jgi:hypothetical protein